MNFLINMYLSGSGASTVGEVMERKKKLFGITDTTETHKVAMGLFLDNFKTTKQEDNTLATHEWFAGSLSQKRLISELKSFIESKEMNTLLYPNEIKTVLNNFISQLEKGQEHAYMIDLARSEDFNLALLAATGRNFKNPEANESKYTAHIEEITQSALKLLTNLKKGEKALFLTGSLRHETRISLQQLENDKWELIHYNSNSNPSFKPYLITKETLFGESFLKKIFELKFTDNSINELNKYLENKCTCESLDNDLLKNASIRRQARNTCHIQSLLAVLKKELIFESGLDSERALIAWNDLKSQFGKFLIDENGIKDNALLRLAKNQKNLWNDKTELRCLFERCKKEGKEEETLTTYKAAIEKFTSEKFSSVRSVINLNDAHKLLLKTLDNSLLLPEEIEEIIGSSNPCLNKTIEIFKKQFAVHEFRFINQLQSELDFVSAELNLKIRALKDSIGGVFNTISQKIDSITSELNFPGKNNSFSNNKKFDLFSGPLNEFFLKTKLLFDLPQGTLNEEDLDLVLQHLLENPESLVHLDSYPCFVSILLQAYQRGKWEKLDNILKNLNEKDFKVLAEATKRVNFCTSIIPSIKNYLSMNPDTSLLKFLAEPIFDQYLFEDGISALALLTTNSDPTVLPQYVINLLNREKIDEAIEVALILPPSSSQIALKNCFDKAILEQGDFDKAQKLTLLLNEPLRTQTLKSTLYVLKQLGDNTNASKMAKLISESLQSTETHKVDIGLFFDNFKTTKQEDNTLATHERFAGSLSQKRLISELKSFIESKEMNTLLYPNEIKTVLNNFISQLEKGQEHAYMIDLARSEDLNLAATGGNFKNPEANEVHIKEITQSALKLLENLKKGEKALFLTGSLTHETRISLEHLENIEWLQLENDKWRLIHYNSNSNPSFTPYIITKEKLFDESFLKKIFELKFTDNSISELNEYLGDKCAYEILDNDLIKNASIEKQAVNTSHIQSLLAVLKKELIFGWGFDSEEALIAWRELESHFGKFLIDKNGIKDNKFTPPSEKSKEPME